MSQTESVHWEFSPDQQKARDCLSSGRYDLVNFRGGFGSGKTIVGSSEVIETANDIPNGRTLVLSQDKQKGKSTTFHVLFERLPGENTAPNNGGDPENSHIVESYSKSDDRLTLTNGHAIQFGSGANWRATAGAEYNLIWCDEVAHYETNLDKLLEMLMFRLRRDEGPNVMLWTTTGDGFNQYWRIIIKRQMPDGEPIKTEIADIVADTRDNPYLPNKDRLVSQYEGTPREIEALAGGFAAAENRVYAQFGEPTHVVSAGAIDARHWLWRLLFPAHLPAAYKRKSSRYGYAYSPAGGCVCLELRETTADQLVVCDEFVGDDDTTHISDVCDWLSEHPNGDVFCIPITSEYDVETLASSTDNRIYETGEDTVRATPLIRREFELTGDRGLGGNEEGVPRLILTDECDNTSRALLSHTTDDTTSKKQRSTHTLCCDALRAAVHRTPIPDDDS